MFDTGWDDNSANLQTVDMEDQLLVMEAEISRLRARQVELLRVLDREQVDLSDGYPDMASWVAARLDVSTQTATRLTQVAKGNRPEIDAALSSGRCGLDRAALLTRLYALDVAPQLISEAAEGYSLGRLYGLIDRLRNISAVSEQARLRRPVSGHTAKPGRIGLQTVGTAPRP